jgi:hypothetical protein
MKTESGKAGRKTEQKSQGRLAERQTDCGHREKERRVSRGDVADTNRICLVLCDLKNRIYGPYLAAINRTLIPEMRGKNKGTDFLEPSFPAHGP